MMNELFHYGTKGQKWGHRRYQNPDGSLTPEGRERYRKSSKESINKEKAYEKLKKFDSHIIDNDSIKEFAQQYRQLSHIRVNKNTNGKLYSKNGKLIGMINTEKKSDGHVWIQGLEVFGDNQGQGLGTALLDEAVTNMNADRLSVNKKNSRAKSLYDKYGFNTYDQDDTMYYMEFSAKHAVDYYTVDSDSLVHYGTKGQKWGERRYQNKDGTWTEEGKLRRRNGRNVSRNKPYTDDINDIVRTLSKKEKDFLGAPDKEDWIDKKHEAETLENKAVSFVTKQGDVPVSFVEVWTNGGDVGQIALATRNDPKYRGKGYASRNVEQAIEWCDKYGSKSIKELEWIADRNNVASVNLGKKYGFVEDDPNKHGHDWTDDWSDEYAIMYRKVGKK